MPRLGWDMKVGSVAEWLKRDGDRVEVGETICMIAGDKATTELEALDSGILRIPPRSPELGEKLQSGTVSRTYLCAPGDGVGSYADPKAKRRAANRGQPAGASRRGSHWRGLADAGRQWPRRAHPGTRRSANAAAAAPMPVAGIRRVTAERLVALSAQTVVPVTLTTDADATSLVELLRPGSRRRRRAEPDRPAGQARRTRTCRASRAER